MKFKIIYVVSLCLLVLIALGGIASHSGMAAVETDAESRAVRTWDYVFVEPDNYYKIQGGLIRFAGSHFIPGERIRVTSNSEFIGTVRANQSGEFKTKRIRIPYETSNRVYTFTGTLSRIPYSVNVTVGSNNSWITLSTYYATQGTPITVTGHQFGGEENVTIWFNGIAIGQTKTDLNGDFSFSTTVPSRGPRRQHTIYAVGDSTHLVASQPFSQSD